MPHFPPAELPVWIQSNREGASTPLCGSLGPPQSLNSLSKISSDPQATAAALNFSEANLTGADNAAGDLELRRLIAAQYDGGEVEVTADDVIIANATTGANTLVFQALLDPGAEIICTYPNYGQLPQVPAILGAKISYWHLDPANNWQGSLSALSKLLTLSTKMLVLNNPHNPTGAVLSTTQQKSILELASNTNTTVFSDEIFRPLFHSCSKPFSAVEHASYDRTIATGSLSKSWGCSGVRVGWIVTRNREIRDAVIALRVWTLECVSLLDEIAAREILQPRCSDNILAKNISIASNNVQLLRTFVEKHSNIVSCNLPSGGATAFVKFSHPESKEPVDDMAFCHKLKAETGVLLSPGSLCFGTLAKGDWKGYVRWHVTALPEVFARGLEKIGTFIQSESFVELFKQ